MDKLKVYIILLIIGLASAAPVQVPCNFADTPRGYECRLPDVDLTIFDEFVIAGGEHLPGRTDAMVMSFFSVNNNFRYFPTQDLTRFPNLLQIKVSGSLLTTLEANAVAHRPQLTTLSLSNNLIESVNPAAFNGTTGITDLNLMFNLLRSVDQEMLRVLPNLRYFDIGFNLIERIPATAFLSNPSITELNLNANRIVFMNQSIFDPIPGLTTLHFEANLCYSGSFTDLQIGGNRLNMMQRLQPCFIAGPVEFRCIFGFQFAGVDFDGRYTCLLRGIQAFDDTKIISLGGFHLAGRNDNDVQFVWVDLSDVRFFIQSMFDEFINLNGVQVSASNLQFLQEGAFRNANNLRQLIISINQIRRLEAFAFQHASTLHEIQFIGNQLEYINENAFTGLTQLRELYLYGGHLAYIPTTAFRSLVNLQVFDASINRLERIDSRWFDNNPDVHTLRFNRNEIYAIHESIVDKPRLMHLHLLQNVCIDRMFVINDQTREQVRAELNPCFINYPPNLQRFIMELEGDLSIYDSNGTNVGIL